MGNFNRRNNHQRRIFVEKELEMNFKLITSIEAFPSDNKLYKARLKDELRLKRVIKKEAQILTLQWLRENQIRFTEPFLFHRAEIILTVYYTDERRRDLHNLSVKSFVDQLVSMSIIADDSIKFIPKTSFVYGGKADKSYAVFELKPL